jgi:uncharacterized protein (TIGR00730 family)
MKNKLKAVVFGSALSKSSSEEYQLAEQVGQYLAEQKIDIVSGGYFGLMEGVSKGGYEKGGHTIGILSKIFVEGKPNDYIKESLLTETYWERVKTLIDLGDIYIALKGGTGTLVEVALAMEMANKKFKDNYVFLHTFWKPVVSHLKKDLLEYDARFPERKPMKYIQFFDNINELKKLFEKLIIPRN